MVILIENPALPNKLCKRTSDPQQAGENMHAMLKAESAKPITESDRALFPIGSVATDPRSGGLRGV